MYEILDIVNDHDEVIDKRTSREIQAEGLEEGTHTRTVNILVFDSDGKILLPHRNGNRQAYPNCWNFSCGGCVMSGESYSDAAMRILNAELGIQEPAPEILFTIPPSEESDSFMKIFRSNREMVEIDYETRGYDRIDWFVPEDLFRMIEESPESFMPDIIHAVRALSTQPMPETASAG